MDVRRFVVAADTDVESGGYDPRNVALGSRVTARRLPCRMASSAAGINGRCGILRLEDGVGVVLGCSACGRRKDRRARIRVWTSRLGVKKVAWSAHGVPPS